MAKTPDPKPAPPRKSIVSGLKVQLGPTREKPGSRLKPDKAVKPKEKR